MKAGAITIRAFVLGMLFAALFAVLTVYAENVRDMCLTATQIPVLPYLLLIVMVLLLNPICRLIRVVRAFSAAELTIIFIMGMVSSGLSTFGLTSQVLPIVGSLFNPEWNTQQSEWNRYVVPFVNNEYFLSEPGRDIQESARAYHDALTESLELKSAYDAARQYELARMQVAESEAALSKMELLDERKTEKKRMGLSLAKIAVENARRASDEAGGEWEALRESRGLPGLEAVVETYPGLIESALERVEQTEKQLAERESKAFEKVTVFRRGLPKGMSAYPGFFPMPEDDIRSYLGRLRRLVQGKAAVKALKEGVAAVGAREELDKGMRAELTGFLDAALAKLGTLGETKVFEVEQEQLRKQETLLSDQRIGLNDELKQKSEEKRRANRSQALALDKDIRGIGLALKRQAKAEKRLKLTRERNERESTCVRNVNALTDEIEALKRDVQAGAVTAGDFKRCVNEMMPRFVSMDASLRRYFIGEVPWSQWMRLLVRWAVVVGLTYVILMSLNVLIFRQWAHNEKLTYPLAELPKALIGGLDSDGGIPGVFRNGLFWAGFAVSGTVVGWNLLCATQLVPGLQRFDLGNWWSPYIINTEFHALRDTWSMIFFTMIGLSFLIPKNISFSLWFFHVLFMLQLLLMVWTGHGVDARSFPTNWWYILNFRTAQGQGALIVFSSVMLYKCRKYILCAFAPSMVSGLDRNEQKELKLASVAFVGCSIGLIAQLSWGMGANLYHTIFFYIMILLFTVGLVRAVTEGGLLTVKTHISPFHFVRAFFGLDQNWNVVSLFTPLIIYCGIMFLDIKVFIAPAMANALKLRDDFKIKRGIFHLSIFAAIAIAAITAIITGLIICYARGADAMNIWFYTSLPRSAMFDTIRNMVKDAPTPSPSGALWISIGAVVMAGLLYFRQFVFWLPHPIGMIMLVNPIMGSYWFSILLGWLCNVAVTKYGNKNTYHRARGFFIGLIIGELLIVTLSTIVSIVMEKNIGIDLNRN